MQLPWAMMAPDAPAVIRLYTGVGGIAAHVQGLVHAGRKPLVPVTLNLDDWEDILDRVEDAIDRIVADAEPRGPDGRLVQGELTSAHFRYLAIREYGEHLRRFVQRIDRYAKAKPPSRPASRPSTAPPRGSRKELLFVRTNTRAWHDLQAAHDLASQFADLQTQDHSFGDSFRDQLTELVHESTMLQVMSSATPDGDRCLVWLRSPAAQIDRETQQLDTVYRQLFPATYGFASFDVEENSEARPDGQRALLLEMPGIAGIFAAEHGTHFFTSKGGKIVPIQVIVTPIGDRDALDVLQSLRATDVRWREELAAGLATPDGDPFPLLPVLRLYDDWRIVADLRSGLVSTGYPTPEQIRKFILSQLPLPDELKQ